MKKASLVHLASPGAGIAVRVTPRAARNAITATAGGLRVSVNAPPEDGKANTAVTSRLARALGVPKSALTLTRGATSRNKIFRLD